MASKSEKSLVGDTPDLSSEQDTVSTVEEIGTDFNFKHKIVWKNVIGFAILHIIGLYGIYLFFSFQANPLSIIYTILIYAFASMGVTMGAHRLFTHKSYKANAILRRTLMIAFVMAGQNSLWEWVRDHRQHHKYSDTDADPHNATRGFFFSHIGWLMCKKHPKVLQYGKTIDMSDLEADSWVMFHKKYFLGIYFLVFVIFSSIPAFFWNEHHLESAIVYFGAIVTGWNITWCVNSWTHFYGTKPYDKNIVPVQNAFVSFFALGEGWHNYHHVFPWDYRTSEFGTKFNLTAKVIDFCAKMGWAYDLKTPHEESIKNRIIRTGDNSHEKYGDPKSK